jgi:hypothetical protein
MCNCYSVTTVTHENVDAGELLGLYYGAEENNWLAVHHIMSGLLLNIHRHIARLKCV